MGLPNNDERLARVEQQVKYLGGAIEMTHGKQMRQDIRQSGA